MTDSSVAVASPGPSTEELRFVTSPFWRWFPVGMRRRWWLFRILDLIVAAWPVLRRRRGLLVVRMDGIGDMVLFRAALDHYATVFNVPSSEITVVGCHSWRSVAETLFADYRVITLNEHKFARQPFYRFWMGLRVRSLAPDTVISDAYFRRALMADSLVWMSGARTKIASLPYISERTRSEFTYYLSLVDRVIDTGAYPAHEITRHFRFLSAVAGREISPQPPSLSWRDLSPAVAADGPYIVLNPGSNEFGRRWPFEKYMDVAARARGAGYRVVIVGAGGERPLTDQTFPTDDRGIIDLIGKTDLPTLLDILKHAAGVVSNDTGPAHLAIGLGSPTVVVIGGGHFGCFVPYPDDAKPERVAFLSHKMDCYHCFWACDKRAVDTDAFPCVSEISVDAVWGAVERTTGARPV